MNLRTDNLAVLGCRSRSSPTSAESGRESPNYSLREAFDLEAGLHTAPQTRPSLGRKVENTATGTEPSLPFHTTSIKLMNHGSPARTEGLNARRPPDPAWAPPSVKEKKTLPKGHLIFSADFESGNLDKAIQVEEHEWELHIRPDTHNERHRLWFYFRISNCQRDQKVLLSVVNFSKSRSLYREGMTPVVRSRRRTRWQRIPSEQVFYYRSPPHDRSYVLSWVFQFDQEGDEYYFAYCFPFTYTDLQRRLYVYESKHNPFFLRECLCRTAWGRRLDLLTITSRAAATRDDPIRHHRNKKWAFITSRIHPGETPAQFVVQGVIDFLLGNDPKAKLLRDHIVFKIIPMLNPDGVALGNYRCNYLGYDLNRQWSNPSKLLQPEIYYTKRLMEELHQHKDVDLDVFVDIHAHSVATNGFMYCNSSAGSGVSDVKAAEREEQESLFPRLYDALSEDFSWTKTKFDSDPSKEGTGRRELGQLLSPDVHCYTLETSFYAASRFSSPNSQQNGEAAVRVVPFTPASYMALGKNLALTFVDYYNLTALNNEAFQSTCSFNKAGKSKSHLKSINTQNKM